MTTTADWVAQTRRHAHGSAREPVNSLAAPMTTDTVTLTYPITGISVGSPIEIGWDLYVVVTVDSAQRVLSLLPDDETSAVPATWPIGTRVRVRPRFPARAVLDALNADLNDLSGPGSALFGVVALTRDSAGGWQVPDDAQRVVDLGVGDTRLPLSPVRLTWTGAALRLDGATEADRVVVATPFGLLSGDPDEDVESATGMPFTALDIPPLGAAARLLDGSESQRNVGDAQGDTRRATEVPATALTASATALRRARQGRVQAEAWRLQQRFGFRI